MGQAPQAAGGEDHDKKELEQLQKLAATLAKINADSAKLKTAASKLDESLNSEKDD